MILAFHAAKEKPLRLGKTSILILLYFAGQSLSIIHASNIQAFFIMYKDLIFGIFIYFLGTNLLDTKRKVNAAIQLLVITIGINLLYQLFLYLQPDLFDSIIKPLLYEKYLTVLEVNEAREKYFIEILDLTLMPILIYLLFSKKVLQKAIIITMLLISTILALLSNFRTHLLLVMGSFLLSIPFIIKSKIFRILSIISVFIFIFTIYSALYNRVSYTTLDRFLLANTEEVKTLTSRLTMWKEAYKMGLSSPITGIGLGNFYDLYPYKSPIRASLFDYKNELEKITITDPHNIIIATFAQTGAVGTLTFLTMIAFFLHKDHKRLRNTDDDKPKFTIFSFWLLFAHSLLNPGNTFIYFSLFWYLRALIDTDLRNKTNGKTKKITTQGHLRSTH